MPYILKAEQLETQANKVSTLDESSTDVQYPSAKAVYDALQNIEGGGSTDVEVLVGRKTPEGGEIFNDYENNKSLNNFSHTEGYNNHSSSMAFKLYSCQLNEGNTYLYISGDVRDILNEEFLIKMRCYNV